MRYFVPQFKIATLAPPQDRLRSKIGGIPWGLPAQYWPTCCNQPQKLLAQLCHEPPMLDLGEDGAVLHLFQCLECDGFTEAGRAAFILNRSVLSNALTTVPDYDRVPQYGDRLIGEAFIEGWQEKDDGIPASRQAEFYEWNTTSALHKEFPQINWFDCREKTKFGGSPRWTGNGPMGFPDPPFEFALQFDDYLFVDGQPPTPDEAGCVINTYTSTEGRTTDFTTAIPHPDIHPMNAPWFMMHDRKENSYYFSYTNLASDGTLYVFIDRTRRPHAVMWFLNR